MEGVSVQPNDAQLEEIEVLRSIFEDRVMVNSEWEAGRDPGALWHLKLKVESVVHPLALVVRYPAHYPGGQCPKFEIVADWMTPTTCLKLSKQLTAEFADAPDEPIVFAWVSALADVVQDAAIVDVCTDGGEASHEAHSDCESSITTTSTAPVPVPQREVQRGHCPSGIAFVTGDPFVDRKSTFQAHLCRIVSPAHVEPAMAVLTANNKIARATHNIMAYRCVENGSVREDHDDDGEKGAGRKLARMLDVMDARNVLVVVSRWYGGIHLGPDRFRHINNVARVLIESQGAAHREHASKSKNHSRKKKKQDRREHNAKQHNKAAMRRSGKEHDEVDERKVTAAEAVSRCVAASGSSKHDGINVSIRVRPNARHGTCMTGVDEGFVLADIAQPPADGKANKAVVQLVADTVGVPKRSVCVRGGHKSRKKLVQVRGKSVADVVEAIANALPR